MISTCRCNFMCAYCDIWRLRDDEISTSQAIAMIDEFYSLGMRRLRFDGGEPLMRDDIGELISHAVKKGVSTALATNGSLVEQNIEKLSLLDSLVVSLGGPAFVHEKERMEGSYSQVIAGIRSAKDAGLDVSVNVVLTKGNIAYLTEMAEDAASLGVRMTFEPIHAFAHASNRYYLEAISPGPAEYRDALGVVESLRKGGAPVEIKKPGAKGCSCTGYSCAITPAGEVAPCEHVFYSRRWPSGLLMGYAGAFSAMRRLAESPSMDTPELDSA